MHQPQHNTRQVDSIPWLLPPLVPVRIVTPPQAEFQNIPKKIWIPAFAGMTFGHDVKRDMDEGYYWTAPWCFKDCFLGVLDTFATSLASVIQNTTPNNTIGHR
jgi:hypothetical protein